MESNNLIVEKEKILREEPILSAEKEQAFRKQIAELTDTNNALKEENSELKEQLAYLKKMLYGQKSEKTETVMPNAEQLNFFNEAETEVEASIENIEKVVTFKARKKKRTYNESFEKLEIKEVAHKAENRLCPECGTEMETVGKDFVREEIVYVPAKMYSRLHYVEVLKCASCGIDEAKDAEFDDVPKQVFVKAKAPASMLDGSYCSPELLAHVLLREIRSGSSS